MLLVEILNRRFVDSVVSVPSGLAPFLPPSCRKREKAWGPDILRFLTTIWPKTVEEARGGWVKEINEERIEEERREIQRGTKREGWERVKACTGTKDHGEFLEIGACRRGRQREGGR